jgi:hypothetical protein
MTSEQHEKRGETKLEIESDRVDVREVMAEIRARIADKKRGLYTDDEIREIAERKLDAVLDARSFNADFLREFRAKSDIWNFRFEPETIYRTSRGGLGGVLGTIRGFLKPIQKLFWNPTPMIAALSRQSDLNHYTIHLLHNLTLELTKLNLEVQELRARLRQTDHALELLKKRERALESLAVLKTDAAEGAPDPPARA